MQLGLQILVNICQKLFVQNNFFLCSVVDTISERGGSTENVAQGGFKIFIFYFFNQGFKFLIHVWFILFFFNICHLKLLEVKM